MSQPGQVAKTITALMGALLLSLGLPANADSADTQQVADPPAAATPVAPEAAQAPLDPRVWHSPSAYFKYLGSGDVKLTAGSDARLHITSGDVLLDTNKDCTVTTPLGEFTVPHKSLLYFKVRHGLEHVFVILADVPGSVKVVSAKHSLNLGPGEEAALTDFFPKFQHLVGDDIGRRRTVAHPVGNDKYIVTSEFNLLHTFETLPLMMQLNQSKESVDKGLKERIIKTAAILDRVQQAHGTYYRGGSY